MSANQKAQKFWVALDAGGTMTDSVIVDPDGNFLVGKALTNKADESQSFLGSIEDAAATGDYSLDQTMAGAEVAVYAGTVMLNTLLSKTGSKVGLLVTQGCEDYLLMEKGEGGWLGYPYSDRLHTVTHMHGEPVIPRSRIVGVQERMDMLGNVVIPLREADVRDKAQQLIDQGVETIAIMFIFSHMNGAHEEWAAEIVRSMAPDMPIVTSSSMAPTHKEYTRLASVVAQAYAGERARHHFKRVEERAREHGFDREVSTLLGHGGTVPVSTPRLYESYVSGPVGGILGGHYIGEMFNTGNVVCCDVGGTSFDVGIVRDGMIPITREPSVLSFRSNMPMIHTESIGAGMGSELGIHPITGKLTVGPKSAGSDVGLCLRWDQPTISDCHVVLGYINPDYFLGGDIPLDVEAAREGLRPLAEHFNSGLEEFAESAANLVASYMREFVVNMLRGRGYSLEEYTMLVYGGGGPLGLHAVSEGLNFKRLMTFPFAAVFSAFGILCAPRRYRYHQSTITACPAGEHSAATEVKRMAVDAINKGWESLEKRAKADFAEHGWPFEEATLNHTAYVRFTNQISDFEVPWEKGRLESVDDLHELMRKFEEVYTTIYPAQALYSEGGYQIMEVALSADIESPKPSLPVLELAGATPPEESRKAARPVYWSGDWREFQVYEMDYLQPGNVVNGPALIEHPATTLLVAPDHHIELDERTMITYAQGTR